MYKLKCNPTVSLRQIDNTSFSIICYGRRIVIACDAVTHVSKFANVVVIYTIDTSYTTQHSLKEILGALPPDKFHRIHRSHIISMDFLKSIRHNCIAVNGHYLPISRYYKLQLNQRLQWLLNKHYHFYAAVTEHNITSCSAYCSK
jgi:DNA-binding LytR/AlgR family response regulator